MTLIYAELVAQKLGYKVEEQLGIGFEGTVYSLNDPNLVLKLSHSLSEATQWHNLYTISGRNYNTLNAKYPFLVNMYDHGYFSTGDNSAGRMFYFLEERVDTSKLDDVFVEAVHINFRDQSLERVIRESILLDVGHKDVGWLDQLKEHINFTHRDSPAHLRFALDLLSLAQLVSEYSEIASTDLGILNVGYRGDQLVWFDIGFSDLEEEDLELKEITF